MIWFTSDLHFYHKNIISLSKRPFQNLNEMHETLIKNWNNCVKSNEYVYILGDFSFGSIESTKRILDQLNGFKILIKGNHDFPAHKALKCGFNEVHENIFINLNGTRIYLSHFPYRASFVQWLKHKLLGGYWDIRYNHKRMVNDGNWLLHGHTHQKSKIYKNMIHIGVDAWNYKPVSHLQILNLINKNENS